MFKSKTGFALWARFAGAGREWMESVEGKGMASKAVELLLAKGEAEDAATLENLLTVCAATDQIWPAAREWPKAF